MAVKTDLTFQELQTALTADGLAGAISVAGGKVIINTSILCGVDVTSLADVGVSEVLYKLRKAASRAQDTVNEGLSANEVLTSFPAFSYGAPVDGYVSITQVSSFKIPLNENLIFGTNP